VARVSSPTLLGRSDALARLDAAWVRAGSGRPGVVLLAGEAGIGKSRLLREAAALAQAAGGIVALGSCLHLGSAPLPLAPVTGIIRQLSRSADGTVLTALGPATEDPAGLSTLLASAAGPTADLALTEPAARARMFESVLGLTTRLAAYRPVMLGIEDVHWSDPATRDLLTYLTRNATAERLLLVLSLRTDGLAPADPVFGWLAELMRAVDADRIDLERLGSGDVAGLVAAITGAAPGPRVLDDIWRRSEGNPFFVEELLAAGPGRAPRTLAEILVARVAVLSPTAGRVVRAVAVSGAPIGDQVLAAVLGLDPAVLRDALREPIDAGVLRVDDTGLIRPRHALLGEVIEDSLLVGERRDLHEALARALDEAAPAADDEAAAHAAARARHWDAADRPLEAYRASLDAAQAATSVFAHSQAATHLARALELGPRLAEPPTRDERVETLLRAADAFDLAGDPDAAIDCVRQALSLVDEDEDPRTGGALHSRLGYLRWVTGHTEAALAEHHSAVALVPPEPPSAQRAHALAALAGALMGAGRYAESRSHAEVAVTVAARAGAALEESRARTILGSDLVALGELEGGIAELRAARRLAERDGPLDVLVVAHHNLALNLLLADQRDEAVSEAVAGRDLARRVGLGRRYGPHLTGVAVDALFRSGRWDEAAELADPELAAQPVSRAMLYLSAVRVRLHAARGETGLAAERLAALEQVGGDDLDPDLRAYLALARSETALASGRRDEALGEAHDGLAALHGSDDEASGLPLLAITARILADTADDARAARRPAEAAAAGSEAEAAASVAVEVAEHVRTSSARAIAARATADAARAVGDSSAGQWSAAADAAEDAGLPLLAAEARLEQARSMLRTRTDRQAAATALRSANEAAVNLGAQPLLAAVATLARLARIEIGPSPGDADELASSDAGSPATSRSDAALPGPFATSLSARELEVLRLVADGRSNGQIADALFITRKTASAHVTHILDKLGVGNRLEAAMTAARLGLLEPVDAGDEERSGR
jgi:DNA-binding NarL/FixJ family response regulator/tetratricopeptide (TPR) repeat protein